MKQVSTKWAKAGMDYVYACSQLKAIRQDLVVRCFMFVDEHANLKQGVYTCSIVWRFCTHCDRIHLVPCFVQQQVQRIKNAFTVQVYEGHARIALQQVSNEHREVCACHRLCCLEPQRWLRHFCAELALSTSSGPVVPWADICRNSHSPLGFPAVR